MNKISVLCECVEAREIDVL